MYQKSAEFTRTFSKSSRELWAASIHHLMWKPSATSSSKCGQNLSHHVMPKVFVLKAQGRHVMWYIFGHFLAKFWPEKIASRDGCFLPKLLPASLRSESEQPSRNGSEKTWYDLRWAKRQSPITSVQLTRSTLAGHPASPRGANTTPRPIARLEPQCHARRVYEDQILWFLGDIWPRTLVIRIPAITLASDSAITLSVATPAEPRGEKNSFVC